MPASTARRAAGRRPRPRPRPRPPRRRRAAWMGSMIFFSIVFALVERKNDRQLTSLRKRRSNRPPPALQAHEAWYNTAHANTTQSPGAAGGAAGAAADRVRYRDIAVC